MGDDEMRSEECRVVAMESAGVPMCFAADSQDSASAASFTPPTSTPMTMRMRSTPKFE